MTGDEKQKKDDKAARLSQALRENLRRRKKTQARDGDGEGDSESEK